MLLFLGLVFTLDQHDYWIFLSTHKDTFVHFSSLGFVGFKGRKASRTCIHWRAVLPSIWKKKAALSGTEGFLCLTQDFLFHQSFIMVGKSLRMSRKPKMSCRVNRQLRGACCAGSLLKPCIATVPIWTVTSCICKSFARWIPVQIVENVVNLLVILVRVAGIHIFRVYLGSFSNASSQEGKAMLFGYTKSNFRLDQIEQHNSSHLLPWFAPKLCHMGIAEHVPTVLGNIEAVVVMNVWRHQGWGLCWIPRRPTSAGTIIATPHPLPHDLQAG